MSEMTQISVMLFVAVALFCFVLTRLVWRLAYHKGQKDLIRLITEQKNEIDNDIV